MRRISEMMFQGKGRVVPASNTGCFFINKDE